ncbi:MAG: tetratricopeptide repeat protein [Verrucomicrobiae bacterium]|nr:tetratricopeptide repeat protein [Verrucomicrobiae bacterium]
MQRLLLVGLFLAGLFTMIAQSTEPHEKASANGEPAAKDVTELARQASAYFSKGDYTNALPLFERLVERMAVDVGHEHPLQARNFVLLGIIHNARGNPEKALPLLQRALPIMEKHPEANVDNSDYHIAALMQMGLAHRALINYAEATSAFQRCLEVQEKTFGADSTNCLGSLKALADLYSEQADYPTALLFYRRCMEATQKALGLEHPNVAALQNNVAQAFKEKGDYARALPMYKSALAIYAKAYGSDHPDVATVLNNIAEIQALRTEYEEALVTCEAGLAIRQKVLGNEHRDVVTSLGTLAMIHEALGRKDEALRLWLRCLEIEEKLSLSGKSDTQLATVLSALASFYREQGDYEQALRLVQRSLAMHEKIFGGEHPNVASGLEELGSIYIAEGKRKEAHSLLVRSLEIKGKVFGIDHPAVIRSTFNLALLDADQNELARSLDGFQLTFVLERRYLCNQLVALSEADGMRLSEAMFFRAAVLHSFCGLGMSKNLANGVIFGAEQLANTKALSQEVQSARAACEANPDTATLELNARLQSIQSQLSHLSESKLDPQRRDKRRKELQSELSHLSAKIAERIRLVEQATKELHLTFATVAEDLPKDAALVDFICYPRYDFAAAKTNLWKENRYAAYLTFPLARDSTNLVVERVDLGEVAPIDEAVAVVLRRFSAGQFRARDAQEALQRLSDLIYAPLAKHLTNVSHLIVCPDGQLGRLPFEMLPVGGKRWWSARPSATWAAGAKWSASRRLRVPRKPTPSLAGRWSWAIPISISISRRRATLVQRWHRTRFAHSAAPELA